VENKSVGEVGKGFFFFTLICGVNDGAEFQNFDFRRDSLVESALANPTYYSCQILK